jgi:hypothetical protein
LSSKSQITFYGGIHEILYKKIVQLRQKRVSLLGHRDLKEKANFILNNSIFAIDELVKKHEKDFKKYASIYNKYNVDFGLKDDLIQLMKSFQEGFLS